MTDEARALAALERLFTFVETTPRERADVEPPWPLTQRLVHLEFAWAFFRLGAEERGGALAQLALAKLRAPVAATWAGELGAGAGQLSPEAFDERFRGTASLVADLYVRRLEEARGRHRNVMTEAELTAGLFPTIDSMVRYSIARLMARSRVLAPWSWIDAIGDYWSKAPLGWRSRALDPDRRSGRARSLEQWSAHAGLVELSPQGVAAVERALQAHCASWRAVTDEYASRLWCETVVDFVSCAVFAIADAARPLGPPPLTPST